jgi:mannose-1-phosphate guanylyltransferase
MQALILAGGEGTRLRPLTYTVPKPVLPLAGRPHVAYVIDWLARHGVDDVIVSCGFLAEGMRKGVAELEPGVRIRYAEEPDPRGTAGAIRYAEEMLADRFLVLNGDVLSDLDLSALIAQHDRTGAQATIALYPVEDPTGYGLVHRREDGEITEFLEKPEPEQVDTDEINAGAYLLESSVLERIPPDRAVSIEREVFPRLIGEGLYGIRLGGYWIDIGTPDRYLEANWDILEGRVETVVSERVGGATMVGEGCEISSDAELRPPCVLGRDCVVAGGAVIERSVLLDGCRVGQGARLVNSILSGGVSVEPGAELDGAVIGEGELVDARALRAEGEERPV